MTRQRFCQLGAASIAFCIYATHPITATAEPGEIKGQDVKGDREKSANDGWSQAPVPREDSAGKDTPDPGGRSTGNKPGSPNANANGDASSLNNGPDDPQKPLDHRTPGPSGQNPASPSAK